MASIEKVKSSNGSGNANLATVQNLRSAGASTIIVDTVLNINPAGFIGTMGTPHTFTDPVTSEVITVISQATAVDFAGHVNSGHVEIDTIAPGYTDLGSKVGDIIVIRPTTQWGDNLAAVLAASHNDNGSLIPAAVRTALSETTTSDAGWTPMAQTPNTVVANGNRSYNLTFNAVDLTTTLSAGMRLKTTRTVAAPTQCTSLNGSTQSYSRTSGSVAGMTFTDDFTASAWVKLSSYQSYNVIISRYNGTSGWAFAINSDGTVELVGFNGGGANNSKVKSYQSVPLNKWVHLSGNLDMSAFATNTDGGAVGSCITFDGINVPAAVSRTGTNPTALIQAGNLEIGTQNAGSFFPGKLAQVAVFSSKITNATMLTYMSQGLAGTETSLISAYSFSGVLTDLNTNANTLTANGSAVATNADAPWGGQANNTISSTVNYAIITKTAFSTNTTLTVQVPEGCTIATSGGVSAVSYATVKAPYGMPVQSGKWRLLCYSRTSHSQGATNGLWYNIDSQQLTIPIGEWKVAYTCSPEIEATTSTSLNVTLSSGISSESDVEMTAMIFNNASAKVGSTITREKPSGLSLAAATPYYLNYRSNAGSSITINTDVTSDTNIIYAEPAYL